MPKSIVLVVLCLMLTALAGAQSKFPELEKIKQIKLLESTRDDVKMVFAEYLEDDAETEAAEAVQNDEDEDVTGDHVSTESMTIYIQYSRGT